ncbi:MAG: helix-turn-helix domain-containing protein [Alkalispirochaeta sp.]
MEEEKVGLRQILGSNIRIARLSLGYSQQTLAEKAQISTGHMNDIEQGRKWVSEQTLMNIASALLVSPWMLLLPKISDSDDRTAELRMRFNTTFRKYLDAAIESAWEEIASTFADTGEDDSR